jgi:hypothetical protein
MSANVSLAAFVKQGGRLTGRWHSVLNVVREQNTIHTLPFVLFALVHQAALLTFEFAFLILVEAFKGDLFTYFTAAGVSLMLAKCRLVGKRGTAAVALNWEEVTAVEVLPGLD